MRTVNQMDLDALSAARQEEWARLDELSRSRRLSGTEVDELVTRYRAASADLADIKTSAGRTAHGDHVSTMLARARLRLTGAPENVARQIPRFFALQLPAALYRVRWTTLVIAVVFVGVVALVAFWVSGDPALVASLGSRARSWSTTPRTASPTTTARTPQRCSRARSGRTTPGSPRSACSSGSPECGR